MNGRVNTIVAYSILGVLTVFALYPVVGIVSVALHDPASYQPGLSLPTSFDLTNIERVWRDGHFSSYMRSSAIVSASVIALATPLSIAAGYAFAAMKFRGRDLLFAVFLLGLIIPSETIVIPLYYDLRSLNLIDTYLSLVLPEAALLLAFGTYWMRTFFRSVPRSLFDAARVDGAPTHRVLIHVLLPIARPAILTMVVLYFLWSWNEFLLPLVMISADDLRTAPLGLGFLQGQRSSDVPGLAAGALILSLPVIVVYALLQRHFVRGMLSGAAKG